ncbi:ABC transporter permease [Roseimaritima ulvae]|uniref:Lipoprotein-releasing system transmembrane protein LolE n=1 Tax=Roseimaritima ulvae TaxID=980254 RepID=A0A5B9QRU0_9BACT|nr:FtsX-like permease family protein [Roseimaritima ulvae]QEG41748.1 Lipoprotein-releasing system transmembrane protein LolE [Roseimaritima ulvae]
MYRWLLCFRYLRTRYIALASVISVTLGVGTLIVVNSVMSGFSAEMHDKMQSLASDIVIESHASNGLTNPEAHLAEIRRLVGNQLAGSSFSVHTPAMLAIEHNGQVIRHQVNLTGLDPETYASVTDFGKYLLHPENRKQVQFQLREDGYPDRDPHYKWGAEYRQWRLGIEKARSVERERLEMARMETEGSLAEDSEAQAGPSFGQMFPTDVEETATPGSTEDFAEETTDFPGLVLGLATCSFRTRTANDEVQDFFYCRPGDDVRLMFANASDKPKAINQKFTVVDMFESGMSEYDGSFAFCDIRQLQELRGMIDPQSQSRSVTTIQLRLVEGANLNAVRDTLQARFPANQFAYNIQTWRDMQGPLLAAVAMETTILNILLFLIIAVAGFGILATFFMIVVEKTRDIGTLKALGASSGGVMSIFLSYGLTLGIVGAGVGLVGGLLFVANINPIAAMIETVTGQEVFDPTIYYFNEIPTIVEPLTVTWVMIGAVMIAVMASVLPALRAARMHPVQSLRYE